MNNSGSKDENMYMKNHRIQACSDQNQIQESQPIDLSMVMS